MEGAGDDDDNTAGSSAPTGFLLDGCPFETLDHLVSRFVDVQKASKKKKKRAKALKGSRQKQVRPRSSTLQHIHIVATFYRFVWSLIIGLSA